MSQLSLNSSTLAVNTLDRTPEYQTNTNVPVSHAPNVQFHYTLGVVTPSLRIVQWRRQQVALVPLRPTGRIRSLQPAEL